MTPERDHPGPADGDPLLVLGAALLGALVLGAVFGVETHSDLLLLLAIVAAVGFLFERIALPAVRRRMPRGRDGPP